MPFGAQVHGVGNQDEAAVSCGKREHPGGGQPPDLTVGLLSLTWGDQGPDGTGMFVGDTRPKGPA